MHMLFDATPPTGAAPAAGTVDLGGVTTIIQGLADGLLKIAVPISVIGIVLGGMAMLLGYQHGPHILRNSILAVVIIGLAEVFVRALLAGTGA